MLPLRTIRKTKQNTERNDLKNQRDNESTRTRGSTLQKDEKHSFLQATFLSGDLPVLRNMHQAHRTMGGREVLRVVSKLRNVETESEV